MAYVITITHVLVSISLAVLVVTVSVALSLAWTLPDISETSSSETICLNISGNTNALTCGDTSSLLQAYLSEQVQRDHDRMIETKNKEVTEYIEKHNIRQMQVSEDHNMNFKPAAKLTGSTDEQEEGHGSMTTITTWNSGRSLQYTTGFQRYGVKYKHGRLIVPLAGTYVLYSSVELYERWLSTPDAKNDDKRPLRHALFKYNIHDNVEVEIVASTQDHEPSSNEQFSYYHNYISTIAHLDAGDEVSVKISNVSFLQYPDENFFGLNLISSPSKWNHVPAVTGDFD